MYWFTNLLCTDQFSVYRIMPSTACFYRMCYQKVWSGTLTIATSHALSFSIHFQTRQLVNHRMRSFLLLIAVISELSLAFVPQLKFFGSCWIPNIRNERRCFRDLTLSLAPSKSVENDVALASVFERNVASCNESSTAIIITGANGVLGQSLIWYRN